MKELSELLALPVGARLRSADLHVHTPASRDTNPQWKETTPAEFLEMAIDRGLHLIAITDHNSVAWCDPAREAAAGKSISVFPGFELSTSEGHLLGIFERDKPASELGELLVQLGIRSRDFGSLDAISSVSLTVAAERIEAEGGVAIAAHVDRPKGFWEVMRTSAARRKQIYACPQIRAFEIVDVRLREQFATGSSPGYPRRVTSIQGSDCYPSGGTMHELDAVGSRHSYLSMGDPSLSGLRHALMDPQIRVRLMDDAMPEAPAAIVGLWVSGGFFEDQRLRFSTNITCLIGGTGSGKSLTLELLRFALEQQVDGTVLPQIAREINRLLEHALGDLATVSVLVEKGGERYLIQRTWVSNPASASVYRVDHDQIEPITDPIDVPSFFPIKGFSQGEIIEYAREPLARLSLLDDLIEVAEMRASIARLKVALGRNAAETLAAMAELTDAQAQIKELPGVLEDIKRVSKLVRHPSIKGHEAWFSERRAIEGASEHIATLREHVHTQWPTVPDPLVSAEDLGETTPSSDLIKQVNDVGSSVRESLATAQIKLVGAFDRGAKRLGAIIATWQARYDEADLKYQEVVSKLDPATRSQAALNERLSILRATESRLKGAKDRIDATIQPGISTLEQRRNELLTELQSARKSIRGLRETKAAELSEALERRVLIKVSGASDHRRYLQSLLELRTGSFVQENDLRLIVVAVHPVTLVKLLLSQDFDGLERRSKVPAEVFARLLENVVTRRSMPDLYKLQLVDVEDIVRVQLAIEAQTYRDLEDLAHGQKCTVVLMIALAEGSFPLLVDQPEDALHAPWIESYIVSSLRNRRGIRQSLFATRSANVLVSADAEQIIALKADARRGVVDQTGSLDRFETRDLVLYHVEGGEPAFARRQDKYAASKPF
jgi:hypothetical protein